ncbi:PREDICTED: uncharacterized protein LOC109155106 [Ipomoea nil]|uniref:uncharacterized protein LOC109155106 n=1 Tax=Ipomoea nil TaxID=35883 RepID=UPI000901A8D7|nr:PREDICTED: uncharacterized protein LOC109155106 [Ipomoea nil]XP_019158389.1 PREDICTED: uncharacterized protein LOC109155106 [Ipomoea nil]
MDEEQLPEPKRRKIEDTVIDILTTADLETATELSVRTDAAVRLGCDLSTLPHKRLIRDTIESFLLSSATSAAHPKELLRNNNETDNQENDQGRQVDIDAAPDPDTADGIGQVICKLTWRRMVTVRSLGGETLVSIWEYYRKDGKQIATNKGVNMTVKQWSSFRSSFPAIEEAIIKMESKIRCERASKKTKADKAVTSRSFTVDAPEVSGKTETYIPSSNDSFNHQENGSVEKKQADNLDDTVKSTNTEGLISIQRNQKLLATSSPMPNSAPEERMQHNSLTNFPSVGLVPITRLDGKNYYCWKHLMEFFLKQLNIAYVLTEPCPKVPITPEVSSEETLQAKAAVKKWIHDDHVCCRSILNSLSDKLFEEYSNKTYTSKELWEKLKLIYDEDFGTMRSQVNKYIQFQILDGISILDQVIELNNIADSIMASGVLVDENFHVSAIISKLPPSWKDYRVKLMNEKFLPLKMLMHRLKTEEDSRDHYRYRKPVGSSRDGSKHDCTFVPRN